MDLKVTKIELIRDYFDEWEYILSSRVTINNEFIIRWFDDGYFDIPSLKILLDHYGGALNVTSDAQEKARDKYGNIPTELFRELDIEKLISEKIKESKV